MNSLWIDTAQPTSYAPVARDVEVEVAVIGAGTAGVTGAFLLRPAGPVLALVE
jgi:cation diffusion facilitator CzcD-associated flavoprotein CzcO